MRIVEKPYYVRSPERQTEMDAIVSELKLKYPPKPRPVKPDGMSEADFILSLQTPAAQRVIKMSETELEEHRNRPMPKPEEMYVNPEAVKKYQETGDPSLLDEITNRRAVTPSEFDSYERMRRSDKNDVGMKEKDLPTIPEWKKEKALEAFAEAGPAKVSQGTIKYFSQDPYKTQTVWVEVPWYRALWSWAKGNKIKRIEASESTTQDWRSYTAKK